MTVVDNPKANRFEVTVDGGTAFLTYERRPGIIVFVHTEVPPELRGHGLADALAETALKSARAEGLRIIAQCPFVRAYMKKHPAP